MWEKNPVVDCREHAPAARGGGQREDTARTSSSIAQVIASCVVPSFIFPSCIMVANGTRENNWLHLLCLYSKRRSTRLQPVPHAAAQAARQRLCSSTCFVRGGTAVLRKQQCWRDRIKAGIPKSGHFFILLAVCLCLFFCLWLHGSD